MTKAADAATTHDRIELDRTELDRIELEIAGMTCASCATRIERKLNKIDGVTASVNFATEKATVDIPAGIDPDDMISVVRAAGYDATPARTGSRG